MSRGFFAIGIYHPKFECNAGGLWRSAFAFGASFVFTVGRRFKREAADTPKTWQSVPMFNFEDLDDLKKHLPYGCTLVGVELDDSAVPLNRFAHPERACYLLGAEDHGLPPKVMQACHRIVQIPDLKVCLNVSTTGSLVMYHRSISGWADKRHL